MSDNPLNTALHTWRHTGAPGGTIGYAGHLPARDQLGSRQRAITDLLSPRPGTDWTAAAAVLDCLSDPARLAALAGLATAPADLPTEHAAPLHAAGLITRRPTGAYDLTPQAVIPLLTILAAATDLATDIPAGPPTDTSTGSPTDASAA